MKQYQISFVHSPYYPIVSHYIPQISPYPCWNHESRRRCLRTRNPGRSQSAQGWTIWEPLRFRVVFQNERKVNSDSKIVINFTFLCTYIYIYTYIYIFALPVQERLIHGPSWPLFISFQASGSTGWISFWPFFDSPIFSDRMGLLLQINILELVEWNNWYVLL